MILTVAYTDVEFPNGCIGRYSRVTICYFLYFKRKPVLSGLNQVITNITFVIKYCIWKDSLSC